MINRMGKTFLQAQTDPAEGRKFIGGRARITRRYKAEFRSCPLARGRAQPMRGGRRSERWGRYAEVACALQHKMGLVVIFLGRPAIGYEHNAHAPRGAANGDTFAVV